MKQNRCDDGAQYSIPISPAPIAFDDVDNPASELTCWSDTIIKSEVIITMDAMRPVRICRLCFNMNHAWVPCYNLAGGIELEPSQLEAINKLAEVKITYETDHSSVVCSSCITKLEDFMVMRNLWMTNDIQIQKIRSKSLPIEAGNETESADPEHDGEVIIQTRTEEQQCTMDAVCDKIDTVPEPETSEDAEIIDISSDSDVECVDDSSKHRASKAALVRQAMRYVFRRHMRKRRKISRKT